MTELASSGTSKEARAGSESPEDVIIELVLVYALAIAGVCTLFVCVMRLCHARFHSRKESAALASASIVTGVLVADQLHNPAAARKHTVQAIPLDQFQNYTEYKEVTPSRISLYHERPPAAARTAADTDANAVVVATDNVTENVTENVNITNRAPLPPSLFSPPPPSAPELRALTAADIPDFTYDHPAKPPPTSPRAAPFAPREIYTLPEETPSMLSRPSSGDSVLSAPGAASPIHARTGSAALCAPRFATSARARFASV